MEHLTPRQPAPRWSRTACLWLVCGWLCALPIATRAQAGHTLRGVVADESGGVLVGASVALEGPGAARRTRTDARGEYAFADLTAGDYVLTVSHPGFDPATVQRRVSGREPQVADIVLHVRVATQVYVAAADSPGGAASSLFTRVLSGEQLDQLPRSTAAMDRRLRELANASGRAGDVVMYVDGFRRVLRLPPREAIQMIRISSNPFAAEFAEPGRSRVEILTRPGLERHTGQIEFNFNDRILNGRHAFAPERADSRTESVHGYFGGPLIPRRWSVTAYGGRWREGTIDVVNATVVDPDTLAASPFVREISTPRTIDNAWLGSTVQAGSNHIVAVSVSHTRDEASHQGLDSGLDLPDRAYRRRLEESFVRAAVTSTLSPRLISEVRLEGTRIDSSAVPESDAVAVSVLDAFTTGGNQDDAPRSGRTDTVQLHYHLTLALGRTTFKAGIAADARDQRDVDRTGFGGTFIFGSDLARDAEGNPIPAGEPGAGAIDPLEAYRRTKAGVAGYGPSQFWIVEGDPAVAFRQWSAAWFAQGDWTPSPGLTVAYGLRHEFQSHVRGAGAVSPRIGLAWSPDAAGRNTIRIGGGVFREHIPPGVILDTTRFDGSRLRRLVVDAPPFFPDLPSEWAADDAPARPPTLSTLEPGLAAPTILAGSVGFDRRLATFLHASAAYEYRRGTDLLRQRNVNAPIDGARPVPELGAIRLFEAAGRSERHELLLAVRTSWERRFTAFANYTLVSSRTDTDGPTTRPADSQNPSGEFAPGLTDARHQGTAGATLRLPAAFVVSAFAVYRSGHPFNITSGFDRNGDSFLTDRPAFAEPGDPNAIATPFGTFAPAPGPDDAIVPRNFGLEAPHIRVDLHVQTSLGTGVGRARLRIGADVTNVFNRPNGSDYNGVLTSPAFGRPRRAADPRSVELFAAVSF